MALRIEELDWVETPIGVISLRRRHEPVVGHDVYEVKIDDEFLMSSLFTVVESELAHLGLARVKGERLHVLVGGLGLGYTLRAALEDDRVEQVQVIEAVAAVIDWHRRDLLPDTVGLAADPRCDLQQGDFFAQVDAGATPRGRRVRGTQRPPVTLTREGVGRSSGVRSRPGDPEHGARTQRIPRS